MINKYNIGFYSSSLSWGGLEMNFCRYAVLFKENNYQIKVFCVENSPIAKKIKEKNINIIPIKRNKKYLDISQATKLVNILKTEKINLIWIRDPRDIDFIAIVKSLSGIKIIYQQGMQLGIKKNDLIHTLRFSAIDAWITPLYYLSKQIKTHTKFNHKKIHIIPLSIDRKICKSKISKNDARKTLDIPNDKFVLGMLGRIDVSKNQLFLIYAMEKLVNIYPNMCLLLIGDETKGEKDEYLTLLKETINKKNLQKNIYIKPFMENVDIFYKAIDLFTLSSRFETFGMVTIEAMLSGIPILAANTPSAVEILNYGKYGLLYKENDLFDFYLKVEWVVHNYPICLNKSKNAHIFAKHNYNESSIFFQIETLLGKL